MIKHKLKNQIYFLVIFLFNLIYTLIPFFRLKNIFLRSFGNQIGRNTFIHIPVKFFHIKRLHIGENCTINPDCYLDARKGLFIGSNVNVSHNTRIYTLGHNIDIDTIPAVGGPVKIGDNAFIFPNVLIMPNVTIGEGAVIYPGSVVVKDVAPFTVVGGNPARYIRDRAKIDSQKFEYRYWFVQ